MRGHVVVEGTPASWWPQITLTRIDGLNYPDFAIIDVDGRFALKGLEPAPYRVNVGSISPPRFMKSARFNGHDGGGKPIDLASPSTAPLEIVISDRATSSVSDSAGRMGPGVTVAALSRTTPGPVPTAPTDEKSRSRLNDCLREYVLIAMDTGGRFPLLAPDFLEKLGKVVTVADSASATADLRLTTMDHLRAADLR